MISSTHSTMMLSPFIIFVGKGSQSACDGMKRKADENEPFPGVSTVEFCSTSWIWIRLSNNNNIHPIQKLTTVWGRKRMGKGRNYRHGD